MLAGFEDDEDVGGFLKDFGKEVAGAVPGGKAVAGAIIDRLKGGKKKKKKAAPVIQQAAPKAAPRPAAKKWYQTTEAKVGGVAVLLLAAFGLSKRRGRAA